jgi:hypothetical protein
MYSPVTRDIAICQERYTTTSFSIGLFPKKDVCEGIRHEIIHSIETCGDRCSTPAHGYVPSSTLTSGSCCFNRLAQELTAYMCSGSCGKEYSQFDGCINYAIASLKISPDFLLLGCPGDLFETDPQTREYTAISGKHSWWFLDWWQHNGAFSQNYVCDEIYKSCGMHGSFG